MASLRRHKTSKFWYACITLPDGRHRQFSTGLDDKAEARAVAIAAEREANRHHAQPSQLTKALQRLAAEFTPKESINPTDWLKAWLESRRSALSPSTARLYADTIRDLATLAPTATTWLSFTDAIAKAVQKSLEARHSPGTVNAKVSRLSAAWEAAKAEGIAQDNPWRKLDHLRAAATKRREFRSYELDALLAAVSGEWRALTLLGLHTGQRLNDLATVRWSNIDLAAATITFTAAKTRTLVSLPLAKETVDSLMTDTPGSDRPDAPVFPTIAALAVQARSDAFRAILESVGLASPVVRDTARNRHSRRQTAPLSFHSLRHTFTTRLKSAGVSDSIAKAIVGHASSAVSRAYTHLDMDTMRAAIGKIAAGNP